MAIQAAKYKHYNIQQQAAKTLAEQMADEQDEESGFGSFMSIAAPLAASLILPGVGTALMGGLGGMAGGAGMLGSILGGAGTAAAGTTAATAGTGLLGALAGTGTGALSTIGGGLLAGAGRAAGTYAISDLMEDTGRTMGYGGESEDIDLSAFGRRGKSAQEEGRANLQSSIDEMEEGQVRSALTQGLFKGVDKMGGFDKIKETSAEFGKKLSGQTGAGEYFNPGTVEGLGMGKAAGDIGIGKAPLESIADTPLTEMPTPKFQSSVGSGGSPLNFLTGEGAQTNLLDTSSYNPGGTSMLEGLFDRSPLGSIDQGQLDFVESIRQQFPGISEEELLEMLQVSPYAGQ